MIQKGQTVFILDDVRNIKFALKDANLLGSYSFMPKVPEGLHFSLARNVEDAMNIINSSKPFDIWVLDNDLGINKDGQKEEVVKDFLPYVLEKFPDKAPKQLFCCSGNWVARPKIVGYWENWVKHVQSEGKPSLPPGKPSLPPGRILKEGDRKSHNQKD